MKTITRRAAAILGVCLALLVASGVVSSDPSSAPPTHDSVPPEAEGKELGPHPVPDLPAIRPFSEEGIYRYFRVIGTVEERDSVWFHELEGLTYSEDAETRASEMVVATANTLVGRWRVAVEEWQIEQQEFRPTPPDSELHLTPEGYVYLFRSILEDELGRRTESSSDDVWLLDDFRAVGPGRYSFLVYDVSGHAAFTRAYVLVDFERLSSPVPISVE